MIKVDDRLPCSEVLERVVHGKERLALIHEGKLVAAIIPLEDLEILAALEEKADLESCRVAKEEIAREGTIPLDSVLKEFDVSR